MWDGNGDGAGGDGSGASGTGRHWRSPGSLGVVKPLPLPGPPKRDTTQETEIESVLLLGPKLCPLPARSEPDH